MINKCKTIMEQISKICPGHQTYTYNMTYKPENMNDTIHKYQKAGDIENVTTCPNPDPAVELTN